MCGCMCGLWSGNSLSSRPALAVQLSTEPQADGAAGAQQGEVQHLRGADNRRCSAELLLQIACPANIFIMQI
jgi:hypothetical protein